MTHDTCASCGLPDAADACAHCAAFGDKPPIQPLHDRVLVRRLSPEVITAGGIIIPEPHREAPQQGEVVAVGTGQVRDDGTVRALIVREGQRVIFAKWSGHEIKVGADSLMVMREHDILAIVAG